MPVTGPLTSNSASTVLAMTRGDSFIRYNSSSDKAYKKWHFIFSIQFACQVDIYVIT